jgi:hypothetical protein
MLAHFPPRPPFIDQQVIKAIYSIRDKLKVCAKNMTEPDAPTPNPTARDRSRGLKLLALHNGRAPTNKVIKHRVAILSMKNRFISYTRSVSFLSL